MITVAERWSPGAVLLQYSLPDVARRTAIALMMG